MHLVQSKSKPFDLEAVREQLHGDWESVNREIIEHLNSDVALVNSVSHYIISSGGKRLRPGRRVIIDAPANLGLEITAPILDETADGGRIIRFAPPVGEWLEQTGQTPLPPYIHETLDDPERYQTVFSRQDGSVAAPTAGLHFTPELLIDLRRRGVNLGFVTLHIGLDTFQPVRVEATDDHPMHSELATLTAELARRNTSPSPRHPRPLQPRARPAACPPQTFC